jgi:hypothetical protein
MIKRTKKPADKDVDVLKIPDHMIPLIESRAAQLGVLPGVAAAEILARGLVAFGATLSPRIIDYLKQHGLEVPQRDPNQPLDPKVQEFIESHWRPAIVAPKRRSKKHGLD